MQGKKYLYFLVNDAGQFYYQDGDILSLSATPVPLRTTPDGWQDISILIEKNKETFGLDRTYGVPQNYVKDGAFILKTIFYTKGIAGKVYLRLYEQKLWFDDLTYGYYYKKLAFTQIDMSQFDHVAEKVTLNILEGDLMKVYKAKKNSTYELPLVDNLIEMSGLNLRQLVHFSVVDGVKMDFVSGSSDWLQALNIPVTITGTEGQSSGLIFADQATNTGSFASHFVEALSSNPNPITIHVKGNGVFQCNSNSRGTTIEVGFRKDTDSVLAPLPVIVYSVAPTAGNVYNYTFDITLTLNPGDKYYYQMRAPGVNGFSVTYQTGSKMDADFSNIFKTTYIKSLTFMQAATQLVSKMSDGKYTTVISPLFAADDTIWITSGDGIRGLDNAVVKTSWDDLINSFNVPKDLGINIVNNIVYIDKKSAFVSPAFRTNLGEVSGLRVTPNLDYAFTELQIGYPNQDYNQALGDVNGKYEFNVTQKYSSPITEVSTVLSLISKYRADMYGIEFTRLNLDGKTTTDSSSDNDVFMLKVGTDTVPANGARVLDRSLNASASGLIEIATAFNLALSPKRCLFAHGAYLRSCLDLLDAYKLKYQTADKSQGLVIGTVAENADVSIADLPARIFRPYNLEFSTPGDEDLISDLDESPIRIYDCTYMDGQIVFNGFAQKIGIQPTDMKIQAYSLLAGPDCDITQFIQVNE